MYKDWAGPYDISTTFHEPLVMFGYLAAITTTLELVTGIIILPQRQAVLVANRPPKSTSSATDGCGWASGSAGTPSSTRR